MRLEWVVRRSFPGPGGIASMMRTVARSLAPAHRIQVWAARIDAEPFTRTNTTVGAQIFEPIEVDGVTVLPLPRDTAVNVAALPIALTAAPVLRRVAFGALRRLTAPAYVRAAGTALAREWGAPDLVHCWGGEAVCWAAGDAARRARVPFAVTPFAHPGAWGDDAMNAAFYRRAQAVLALLPSEAALYESLGVDAARLHVVGVPAGALPEGGPDVRARHELGDTPLVLQLGVKEPYKGYRTLLGAAPLVWREVPDARFAFVGPRTDASRADFARRADPRVIEAGLVPHEEVAAWLRAATVLCLPSTSEIMPVAILEAWSAGVPVVAAEWWCARDLVTHERDGLVVGHGPEAVAAGLVAVLRDRRGAAGMGDAGRAKVLERYTPAAVAARHEQAYAAAAR